MIVFVTLFLLANTSWALGNIDIPDTFQVTERWFSLTRSFDITSDSKNFGTVYRKFFSLKLTYEFDDSQNNLLATARARFFSITYVFDIYDDAGNLLGIADERLLKFFPAFDLFGADSITKVAHAEMNFWNTRFTISDPATDEEIAVMSRPFIRLKNNWTINITNRRLYNQKCINPTLLMTVLAFQSDSEAWKGTSLTEGKSNNPKKKENELSPLQKTLLNRVAEANKNNNGDNNSKAPNKHTLEIIADELEQGYQKTTTKALLNTLSNQDRVSDFVNYCLQVAESKHTPTEKKNAIFYLLNNRLKGSQV